MKRREFLMGATAFGLSGCAVPPLRTEGGARRDENLSAFLSDLHVRDSHCHQYRRLAVIVDEILAMDPLPAHVIVFGDVAYACGLKPEYEASYGLLRKFIDAGMEVTIGMGNHDRRSTFLSVWPEYRARTLLPGRIVTTTDLGPVDLLMLDGLQGTDGRADDDMGPVDGRLDQAQQDWLYGCLAQLRKPTLLASHYPLEEMRGTGRPLAERFRDYPLLAGYVYGHLHRWNPYWLMHGWGLNEIRRSLCLPSTGHWGDIGYVLFRAEADKGVARFVQKDFFFYYPEKEGERRPQEWDDVFRECGSKVCTFRW